jgi:nucleotidyltransferase/DNA polymerase involved in DNA repair
MSAGEVVSQLRAGVEEKTGLTISAGIAPNKMLAKVSPSTRASADMTDLFRQEQTKRPIRDGI